MDPLFRALRHRDFRLFLACQVVSLAGTWMQGLAQNWLVYRLTDSTLLMGAIGFCQYAPVLLLGPLAGVAADRYSRRKIVIAAQSLFLFQAAALAPLTLSGAITIPLIVGLAVFWGAVNAFDIPARQSLYVRMVGPEDLPNAIALNSMTFNAARIVGPSFAGFFVALFGEGVCFAVNAATFAGVIAALWSMRSPETQTAQHDPAWQRLREGFSYAWNHPRVRALLTVSALANLAMAPSNLLGPVFAGRIFERGAPGLGMLTGALGLGAVMGTAFLARRGGNLPGVVLGSTLTNFAGLAAYAAAPTFEIALGAMGVCGFSIFRTLSAVNTLVQTSIEDEYRGRVMSLYSMSVVGMAPFGNLLAGVAADVAGPRATVCGGALLALAAALFWSRRMKQS